MQHLILNWKKAILPTMVAASTAYLYKDVVQNLVKTWSEDGNYSHGFLVPLLVGYIIWNKRAKLKKSAMKPFIPALAFVFFSGLLLIGGQLAVHEFSRNISLLFMIVSLTLLIVGKTRTKILLGPMSFLLFMLPLPELLRRGITQPLQLFSSYISVNFISFLGYPILREGNVILLPNVTLSVAEACSGLRSLVALTFLSAVVAFFLLGNFWRRTLIILLSIPITIFLNWARITGTVLLVYHSDLGTALGFFHNFSGMIVFSVASLLVGSIVFFLRRKGDSEKEISQTADVTDIRQRDGVSVKAMLAAMALLSLLAGFGEYLFSLKPRTAADMRKLSVSLGPYSGCDLSIPPEITKASDVTQDRSLVFQTENHPPIYVYLGYYRTSRKLKGFFHNPDSCIPGMGWNILKRENLILRGSNSEFPSIQVKRYLSANAEKTQILYTWVQVGNRTETDRRQMVLSYLLNAVLKLRYDDATKVMIYTILAPGESEIHGNERLAHFINYFYPVFHNLVNHNGL